MRITRPDGCRKCVRTVALALVLSLGWIAPNVVVAQLVMPRTVPVQQSGQFDIFPSQRSGMANVSLALDDTLLDPFVNPAKATRLSGLRLFSEYAGHDVSRGGGGGHTIPVGLIGKRSGWAAGGLAVFQDLDGDVVGNRTTKDRRATNQYFSLLLARRFGGGLSIGANAFHAGLRAIDGIGALYAGSDSVGLTGSISDARVGMTKEWTGGRTFELLLLHYRSDLKHDVRFPVSNWDPTTRTFVFVNRFEHNEDRGRVWGAHSEFVAPLGNQDSTRLGLLVTVNRLTHPKIPNYRFSNLPRDPGTTYAFNVGVGLGRAIRGSDVGFDLVYEPMLSHTWAEAGPGATDADGTPIPAGMRTVENRFRFSNVKLAAGMSREFRGVTDTTTAVGFQLGVVVYRNSYRLRQQDNLLGTTRRQQVGWTEWGPTLGVHWRARSMQIAYSVRLTCSPGACDIGSGDDVTVPSSAPGVIASPTANLSFNYGRTAVQRLSLTFPILH